MSYFPTPGDTRPTHVRRWRARCVAAVVALGAAGLTACSSSGTASQDPHAAAAHGSNSGGSSGSKGGGSSGFCAELLGDGRLTAAGPGQQRAELAKAVDHLQDIVDDAPAEVRSELETIIAGDRRVAEGKSDPTTTLSDPTFSAALRHFDLWAVQHCTSVGRS